MILSHPNLLHSMLCNTQIVYILMISIFSYIYYLSCFKLVFLTTVPTTVHTTVPTTLPTTHSTKC